MTHLILLPGLGADCDLFYPQQEYFGRRLTVISAAPLANSYPEPPNMNTAAERITEQLLESLPANGSYVLGGMSFGGSLALEVARRIVADPAAIPPSALVLIASNRTSDTISRSFRVNHAIGSKLPTVFIRPGLRAAARLFGWKEGLEQLDRKRLQAMATRTDLAELMWGSTAIANWRFADADANDLGIPIEQIHGRSDWVIPCESKHVTTTLDDGRHLITWTHREAVNRWLEEILDRPVKQ